MPQLLAHSRGKNPPVPPQTYYKHISEVTKRANKNVDSLLSFFNSDDSNSFREVIKNAAIYHDLGKLDEKNQEVLSNGTAKALPINHIDAGVTWLMKNTMGTSAVLTYSHHAYPPHFGLPSIPIELSKDEFCLRDKELHNYTEEKINEYVKLHCETGLTQVSDNPFHSIKWTGLKLRLALSCLVDADHGDTANNYGQEVLFPQIETKWKERLLSLDRYVDKLGNDDNPNSRDEIRKVIYNACKNADSCPGIYACDSPVGTGKTTAIMAHLLKTAEEKKLRHIIVVLPFTNIIKQSVDVYRRSLVLEGENPEEIVAEHHHLADFDALETRQLATLWKAPIIVTTAVQFFETLANNHPSRLRKLHELPGSIAFVDEAHASIPFHLWPQTWKWIKELVKDWSCYFVLASGSLSRFWELKEIIEFPETVPELIPNDIREKAIEQELKRIIPVRHPKILKETELIDIVLKHPGPRLVVMNTVQSAAVLADSIAKKHYGDYYNIDLNRTKIFHLSTALAPADRENLINIIKYRLSFPLDDGNKDFTLVATSCIEAGVDFSFRSAFRERAGAANLIQIGGRVRRNLENFHATLIDFKIEGTLYNKHPAFVLPGQVLEKLFDENKFKTETPANIVTESLRRELMSDTSKKHIILQKKEAESDYPEVAKLYKVILSDTQLVLTDQHLIDRLKEHQKVDPKEIVRKSINIWTKKVADSCAYPMIDYPGLFAFPKNCYDNHFLGYMKVMLPVIKTNIDGFGII